jgi:hypothetical protein
MHPVNAVGCGGEPQHALYLNRYTEPDLDNVVEGVRAYDGKSYGDLVMQWKQCLAAPDIEDPDSAARRRLEDLALCLRDVYCTKVQPAIRLSVRPCDRCVCAWHPHVHHL